MTKPAFSERRTWARARRLALSSLACLGKHTVTGMISSCGEQFVDWSAAYRIFAENRIDMQGLWSPACRTAFCHQLHLGTEVSFGGLRHT